MSLFREWQSYERDIVPADAPRAQREESRRAFYAGAAAMFALMMESSSPDDDEECERRLAALHLEVLEFPRDLAIPTKGHKH